MIGVPSDAILAYLLVRDIAKETGLKPGEVCMSFVDCHIYANHVKPTLEYLDSYNKHGVKWHVLADVTGTNKIHFPLAIGELK